MSKVSNVYNIGNFIRKNTELKVSPSFVEEAKSTIEAVLDELLAESEQVAKGQGMKTLQDKHLIKVNSFRLPERNRIVACDECGRSFVVASSDKSRKMVCPFCGKKRGIRVE